MRWAQAYTHRRTYRRHGIDVLAHVELIDGVVAVLHPFLARMALAVLRLAGPAPTTICALEVAIVSP